MLWQNHTTQPPDLDRPALDGILQLLKAEESSLSSATLAGLDDAREGWESDIAPEASV